MKKLFQYAAYAILALAAPMALQSCNDDKDIVIIEGELPLKLSHLYMVGDATPAGWNIGAPTEMTQSTDDKFVFTYEGKLKVGEMKLPLTKGDWGATFIFAPAPNTEINENGVANDGIEVRKENGNDAKWKITKTGMYKVSINLRSYKMQVTYTGPEPVTPIASTKLGMIGSAAPCGWTDNESNVTMFTKTSDTPLQYIYTGHLNTGELKLVYSGTTVAGYAGPYLQAPDAGVTLNHTGVSKQGMEIGGADNKWNVTEAGTYKVVFDLTKREIKVESFQP